MATAETATSTDWPGRYYHIDQVLNTGGPRTDPAFAAGDEVRAYSLTKIYLLTVYFLEGQSVLTRQVKDLSYRGWRSWMRDSCKLGAYRIQGHPCDRHGHHRHQ